MDLDDYIDCIKLGHPIVQALIEKDEFSQAFSEYQQIFGTLDARPFQAYQEIPTIAWQHECKSWLYELAKEVTRVSPAMIYLEIDPLNEWQLSALHLDTTLKLGDDEKVWDHFISEADSITLPHLTRIIEGLEIQADREDWDDDASSYAEYGFGLHIGCFLMQFLRYELKRSEVIGFAAHDAPMLVMN